MPAELATTLVATEDDRLLQAEALVRSYCGWHISPSRADESVLVWATDARVLMLPSLYVTAVSSVTIAGTPVESTAYQVTPGGVLTRVTGYWTVQPTTVVFTHGYPTVPPEVQGVVQAVAQRAVDNPGSRPRGQVGPFADTYSQVGFNQAPALGLLDAEKAVLDRYRIPPRP